MNHVDKWLKAVKRKQSLLCVGIDPAEYGEREGLTIPKGMDKVAWCEKTIDEVAPYAAGIKINRNYVKDLSRADLKSLNERIHAHGMISIDDSKIADIESSNEAGLYHAAKEGFDFVTYCPFPGNVLATTKDAEKHGIGLISIVVMSTPSYQVIQNAKIGDLPLFLVIANMVKSANCPGVVLGAFTSRNVITKDEMDKLQSLLQGKLILIPGLGAQDGNVDSYLPVFGEHCVINVGRSVVFDSNPAKKAKEFRDQVWAKK
jgi:orotidine-5'-phosphate decarboxylase